MTQQLQPPRSGDAYASSGCVQPQAQQHSMVFFRIAYPHTDGGVQVLGLLLPGQVLPQMGGSTLRS